MADKMPEKFLILPQSGIVVWVDHGELVHAPIWKGGCFYPEEIGSIDYLYKKDIPLIRKAFPTLDLSIYPIVVTR